MTTFKFTEERYSFCYKSKWSKNTQELTIEEAAQKYKCADTWFNPNRVEGKNFSTSYEVRLFVLHGEKAVEFYNNYSRIKKLRPLLYALVRGANFTSICAGGRYINFLESYRVSKKGNKVPISDYQAMNLLSKIKITTCGEDTKYTISYEGIEYFTYI